VVKAAAEAGASATIRPKSSLLESACFIPAATALNLNPVIKAISIINDRLLVSE
jgi:hypothetical protein